MSISFPAGPTVGQLSSQHGRTWAWSGYAWEIVAIVAGHAATHGVAGADAVSITTAQVSDFAAAVAAASPATTNASLLTSGTLSDGRLSAAVATYAGVGLLDHSPSAGVDVYPRGEATTPGGNGGVLGTVYWTFFTPAVTVTVSAITMATGTTAATGVTLARMGLYTFDETAATLVARTAAETASTLFAAVLTSYLRVFSAAGGYPAAYTLLAGRRYGIASVQVGGTVGALVAGKSLSVPVSLMTPRMNGVLAGQTDLPATTSALTTAQAHHFSRLT